MLSRDLSRVGSRRRRAALLTGAVAGVTAAAVIVRTRRGHGAHVRDAVTVNLREDEVARLWQEQLTHFAATHPGASVRFEPAPGGRGTEVHVGLAGSGRARAQLADELRRFKQIAETGEVVRSEASLGGHTLAEHLKQRAAQPPAEQQMREVAP